MFCVMSAAPVRKGDRTRVQNVSRRVTCTSVWPQHAWFDLTMCKNRYNKDNDGATLVLLLMICWAGLISVSDASTTATAGLSAVAAVPDAAAVVSLHNRIRAEHGAGPLVWSASIAATAAKHAQSCTWRHSTAQDRAFYGENMYYSKGLNSRTIGSRATLSWYDEVRHYNWDNPGSGRNEGAMTGHFTQVVWRNTKSVGCAYVRCPTLHGTPQTDVDLLVCQYDPPGNFRQAYERNVLPPGTSAASTNTPLPTQQPTATWLTAPLCKTKPMQGATDSQGRLWGFENGRSCAYKPAAGSAGTGTIPSSSPAKGAGSNTLPKDAWEAAPACAKPYDGKDAARDMLGRLWGYENGASCAYKAVFMSTTQAAAGTNGSAASTAQGAPRAATQKPATSGAESKPQIWVDYNAAPACLQLSLDKLVRDDQGRLWGYENGKSCAYRGQQAMVNTTVQHQPSASNKQVANPAASPKDAWNAAPECKSQVPVGKRDDRGRLWGFEDGKSCAYKSFMSDNARGANLMPSGESGGAAGGQPGVALTANGKDTDSKPALQAAPTDRWDSAPACTGEQSAGVADAWGRLWGFESGVSCAFKTSTGEGGSSQKVPIVSWDAAPECKGQIPVGTRDAKGRLWGFEDGRSCAYRSFASDGTPSSETVPASEKSQTALPKVEQPLPPQQFQASWDSAPACEDEVTDGTKDDDGRLWGTENGKPCAVKSVEVFATIPTMGQGATTTVQASAAAAQAVDLSKESEVSVAAAPGLRHEMASNGMQSMELWVDGWALAPACKGQPDGATAAVVTDTRGRLWGFEDGKTCAYKD